ncbi:MAG: MotA/TolQ/ExbB proton channel family protein [Desulfomonilia bacterium]
MPFFPSTVYAATTQFRGDIGAMIVDSDPVVKLVLLVLFVFSIFSWGIIVQKWIALSRARKRGQLILDSLLNSGGMVDILDQVDKAGECPIKSLFHGARDELRRITSKNNAIPVSMLANVENRIRSAQTHETMELSHGLGFLASISNSSPFIGLFGTVWGIMDSFREIGLRGSANLATVAPGISEALIATAAGLFVAIPAALFYNYFTGAINLAMTQMERFQIDFMNWVRRGLIHGGE